MMHRGQGQTGGEAKTLLAALTLREVDQTGQWTVKKREWR